MRGERYFLVISGKPAGPFTVDELRARGVQESDFVRSAEMDDFRQISEMRELAAELSLTYSGTVPQYFAGIDQRLLASVIDWLIVFAGWLIVAVALALILNGDQQRLVPVLAFWFLFLAPARIACAIVQESSVKQATWGKRLVGIKVSDEQGLRISRKTSAARNLAKILSTLCGFLGYLLGFFNARHQCLHDSVARTLVIKDRLV